MLCPKCKCELFIGKTRYVAENDNTDEKETKLYVEQDMVCRNKKCDNHEKVIETIRSEMPLSAP